jgi:hypothetical protein
VPEPSERLQPITGRARQSVNLRPGPGHCSRARGSA